MKKIAVVTVCYNIESQILDTMKSVLDQDYTNFEYIIIDGDSKDGTLEKIKETISKYPSRTIKLISEKDSGVYDAMNKGIRLTNSEWIIFMNAGDLFYSSNVLNSFDEYLTENNDVVYGEVIYSHNKYGYRKVECRKLETIKENMPFCHQSTFTKSKLLKECEFNVKYKICSDYDFFYKMYQNNKKFVEIRKVVAIYDIDGISSNYLKNRTEKYKINKDKKILFNISFYYIKAFIKFFIPKKILYKYKYRDFSKSC